MTRELRERMAELRAIAPKLNAATDEAARVVGDADRFLDDLGVGISAETSLFYQGVPTRDVEVDGGREVVSSFHLAYGRVGGKFRIHVVEYIGQPVGEDDWQTLGEERTAWGSCPREIKLRSVAALPELLGLIVDAAETVAQAATKSTAAVRDILGDVVAAPPAAGTVELVPVPDTPAVRKRPAPVPRRPV